MNEQLAVALQSIRMIAELAKRDGTPAEQLHLINALRIAIRIIEGLA